MESETREREPTSHASDTTLTIFFSFFPNEHCERWKYWEYRQHFQTLKTLRILRKVGNAGWMQSCEKWFCRGKMTMSINENGVRMQLNSSSFLLLFAATLWKSNSEKIKHGQMLGREKYFARNTTSSQRKRICAAKYNWRACLPVRWDYNVPYNRRWY